MTGLGFCTEVYWLQNRQAYLIQSLLCKFQVQNLEGNNFTIGNSAKEILKSTALAYKEQYDRSIKINTARAAWLY